MGGALATSPINGQGRILLIELLVLMELPLCPLKFLSYAHHFYFLPLSVALLLKLIYKKAIIMTILDIVIFQLQHMTIMARLFAHPYH